MSKNVVPMIHVPDVRATVDWYQSIGFHTVNTFYGMREVILRDLNRFWITFAQEVSHG